MNLAQGEERGRGKSRARGNPRKQAPEAASRRQGPGNPRPELAETPNSRGPEPRPPHPHRRSAALAAPRAPGEQLRAGPWPGQPPQAPPACPRSHSRSRAGVPAGTRPGAKGGPQVPRPGAAACGAPPLAGGRCPSSGKEASYIKAAEPCALCRAHLTSPASRPPAPAPGMSQYRSGARGCRAPPAGRPPTPGGAAASSPALRTSPRGGAGPLRPLARAPSPGGNLKHGVPTGGFAQTGGAGT